MKRIVFIVLTVLAAIIVAFCLWPSGSRFDRNLNVITKPYRFSLIKWEFGAITSETWQSLLVHESPTKSDIVVAYFSAIQSGKLTTSDGIPVAKLRQRVEKIIQQQVRIVISECGIKNPWNNFLGIHFPPLSFVLSTPPDILVTSPRDKIEILKEVRLQPNLTTAEMESIESKTEKLSVSAMVMNLGGIGTFPAFINNEASLPEVLNDAAHEWIHQYLAFKPLGFRYVLDLLGVSPNYEIVTINETVAGIFGDEIGALVYNKYYASYYTQTSNQPSGDSQPFDFNAAMRSIRLTVDGLLAQRQIDQAEQYMETQRQFLQTKGYYIRKLNQAYFAFNGTYASSPTSISPIGAKIKEIRSESLSIKAFLATMSRITDLYRLNALH